MADVKISNLANLAAAADDDELVIVDVSAGITKKIKASDLVVLTLDGKTVAIDGINSNGGAFPFTTSGKVTLSQQLGVPTIDLTGGQIAFPAGAVPSGDPNTLDDYEEGTWTPAVSSGGTGAGGASGKYVKVGRLITFEGRLPVTAITGTVTTLVLTVPAFTPGAVSGDVSPTQFGVAANPLIDYPFIHIDSAIYFRAEAYAGAAKTLYYGGSFQL